MTMLLVPPHLDERKIRDVMMDDTTDEPQSRVTVCQFRQRRYLSIIIIDQSRCSDRLRI